MVLGRDPEKIVNHLCWLPFPPAAECALLMEFAANDSERRMGHVRTCLASLSSCPTRSPSTVSSSYLRCSESLANTSYTLDNNSLAPACPRSGSTSESTPPHLHVSLPTTARATSCSRVRTRYVDLFLCHWTPSRSADSYHPTVPVSFNSMSEFARQNQPELSRRTQYVDAPMEIGETALTSPLYCVPLTGSCLPLLDTCHHTPRDLRSPPKSSQTSSRRFRVTLHDSATRLSPLSVA